MTVNRSLSGGIRFSRRSMLQLPAAGGVFTSGISFPGGRPLSDEECGRISALLIDGSATMLQTYKRFFFPG